MRRQIKLATICQAGIVHGISKTNRDCETEMTKILNPFLPDCTQVLENEISILFSLSQGQAEIFLRTKNHHVSFVH
jgi:hypothetical protein